MAGDILLHNGILSAIIRPSLGASVARFDHVASGVITPLFRPEHPQGGTSAFDLACQVLIPWSNRISGGGFTFRGRHHALEPNIPGEPFPNHGNGFSLPWDVISADASAVSLRLQTAGPGPYRYEAELSYGLDEHALSMRLVIRNTGTEELPFGMGFHPWIVRTPQTLLQASSERVWLEDERHLPHGTTPVAVPATWNFQQLAPLPPGFVNNAFVGWDRSARVQWPERNLEMTILASPRLSTYMLYSPLQDADFFCFEPVSHPVDAFNLPNPTAAGVFILAKGEMAEAAVEFVVSSSE